MTAPRCCLGMAHYATNPPRQPEQTRFDDPECLIHQADDGNLGIILHDGSGRYSIIQFCPWCGAAVGINADRYLPLAPTKREGDIVRTPDGRPASMEGDALPAYQDEREGVFQAAARSHKAKGSKPKGRQPMSEAKRQALSEKMRLLHAEKKRQEAELVAAAAATVAPGQDEAEETTDGV